MRGRGGASAFPRRSARYALHGCLRRNRSLRQNPRGVQADLHAVGTRIMAMSDLSFADFIAPQAQAEALASAHQGKAGKPLAKRGHAKLAPER